MTKSGPDSGGNNARKPEKPELVSLSDNTGEPQSPQPDMQMAPPPDTARSIGGWMIVMLWIIALIGATLLAQKWFDQRAQARNGVWVGAEGEPQALLVKSNRYGQYLVKGSANDTDVMFLLDTGASGISIPALIAEKLGLQRGRPFDVMTANGITTVYATTLDMLRIGPHSRRDVRAHINPSMDGDVALLGMSFLRHYELLQRAGQLTISNPQ